MSVLTDLVVFIVPSAMAPRGSSKSLRSHTLLKWHGKTSTVVQRLTRSSLELASSQPAIRAETKKAARRRLFCRQITKGLPPSALSLIEGVDLS
jgi:hypothetical protein